MGAGGQKETPKPQEDAPDGRGCSLFPFACQPGASRSSGSGCGCPGVDLDDEVLRLRQENQHLRSRLGTWDKLMPGECGDESSGRPDALSAASGRVPQVVNELVQHMWPFLSDYVHDLLKTQVEPEVQRSLPSTLAHLKFSDSNCHLGSRSIQLGPTSSNVHTQDSAEYGEFQNVRIVAHVDWTSDCELEVLALKAAAGLSSITLHGILVIEFVHLLKRPPMFQGLRIYFINPPEISFRMMGSLTKLTNTNIVRRIIIDVVTNLIAGLMVLPNRITTSIEDEQNIFRLTAPRPEGIIRVMIQEAKGLKSGHHNGSGGMFKAPDPYITVTFGAESWRTSTVPGTGRPEDDPKWESDHIRDLVVHDRNSQELIVTVFDERGTEADEPQAHPEGEKKKKSLTSRAATFSAHLMKDAAATAERKLCSEIFGSRFDEAIGRAKISVGQLVDICNGDCWVPLRHCEDAQNGHSSSDVAALNLGSVHVRAEWRPFKLDRAVARVMLPDARSQQQLHRGWTMPHIEDGSDVHAMLFVGVFGATGLPYPRNDAAEHWCSVSCSQAGRKAEVEVKDIAKQKGRHPLYHITLGEKEDPNSGIERRKQLREQIAVLKSADLPYLTIAQVLGLPQEYVAAHADGNLDADEIYDLAASHTVEVAWNEPVEFMLRDPAQASCTFEVKRDELMKDKHHKEEPVRPLGKAVFAVKDLMEKERLTDTVTLKLSNQGSIRVFAQLWILGASETRAASGDPTSR